MIISLASGLGFAAFALIVLALVAWIVTRHMVGPGRATPLSIVTRGWRLIRGSVRTRTRLLAVGTAIWLGEAWAKDLHTLLVRHFSFAGVASDTAIDLLFALGWTAFAIRLHIAALAPKTAGPDIRRRARRAVFYALGFWFVLFVVNLAGLLLVVLFKGRDQSAVLRIIHYLTYLVTAIAALTRPGIAIASKQPLREALAVVFGGPLAVGATLILAILPLGLVLLVEDFIAASVTMPILFALLLEIPFAVAAMFAYAAFEAAVAFLFKRTAYWVIAG